MFSSNKMGLAVMVSLAIFHLSMGSPYSSDNFRSIKPNMEELYGNWLAYGVEVENPGNNHAGYIWISPMDAAVAKMIFFNHNTKQSQTLYGTLQDTKIITSKDQSMQDTSDLCTLVDAVPQKYVAAVLSNTAKESRNYCGYIFVYDNVTLDRELIESLQHRIRSAYLSQA